MLTRNVKKNKYQNKKHKILQNRHDYLLFSVTHWDKSKIKTQSVEKRTEEIRKKKKMSSMQRLHLSDDRDRGNRQETSVVLC